MQFFKNLSIGKKITALISALTLLLLITSVFGIVKMHTIGQEFDTIQTEDMPLIELVSDITVKQLEKAVLVEKAMRIAGVTDSAQTLPELHQKITRLAHEIDNEIKAGESILATAKAHSLSEILKGEIDTIEHSLLSVEEEHRLFEGRVEGLMKRLEHEETLAFDEVLALEHAQETIDRHLEAILAGIEKMTEHGLEQVHHDEESALHGMIWLSAASILIGLLLGVLITRAITKPLAQAVAATKRLAAGDLTVQIDATSTDETGQLLTAMREMSARLLDMVSHIAAATEQLSGATGEVAAVTTQTARNIESQTEQLDQTSVAMTQMSATVHDVSRNAAEAAASTASADRQARKGQEIVVLVNSSIQELSDQIEHSKAAITRLDAETEQVDSILDVITSVAEQTNLLALNAAIEAARAGESGRGFAVVAGEVRTLASKTQQSIITIQEMISTLKKEARTSVDAMNEGYTKAGATVELARQAEGALLEITGAIDTISNMNIQIAGAAEQQSAVAEQVSASVTRIHDIGTENSAGAQQVAVASEELAQLSENLKGLVGQFKVC